MSLYNIPTASLQRGKTTHRNKCPDMTLNNLSPGSWGYRIHQLHFCRWIRHLQRVSYCPVSWGCRTHQQHLCRGVKLFPQQVSWYDAKHSDGEAPVMRDVWGMWSTPSLLSLSGPLWPGVEAPDRVLSMSQMELFDI